MWIAQQVSRAGRNRQGGGSESGAVTVSGEALAVLDGGERREVALCAPEGILWRPRVGQSVLLLSPEGGCQAAALGTLAAGSEELEPGELRLQTENASITLRNDGQIEIQGTLVYLSEETEETTT